MLVAREISIQWESIKPVMIEQLRFLEILRVAELGSS